LGLVLARIAVARLRVRMAFLARGIVVQTHDPSELKCGLVAAPSPASADAIRSADRSAPPGQRHDRDGEIQTTYTAIRPTRIGPKDAEAARAWPARETGIPAAATARAAAMSPCDRAGHLDSSRRQCSPCRHAAPARQRAASSAVSSSRAFADCGHRDVLSAHERRQ